MQPFHLGFGFRFVCQYEVVHQLHDWVKLSTYGTEQHVLLWLWLLSRLEHEPLTVLICPLVLVSRMTVFLFSKKDLNFTVPVRRTPVLITGKRSGVHGLDVASNVRLTVKQSLRKTSPQKEILRTMKNDPSIIILPADKNTTVILDHDVYDQKITATLSCIPHSESTTNYKSVLRTLLDNLHRMQWKLKHQ